MASYWWTFSQHGLLNCKQHCFYTLYSFIIQTCLLQYRTLISVRAAEACKVDTDCTNHTCHHGAPHCEIHDPNNEHGHCNCHTPHSK